MYICSGILYSAYMRRSLCRESGSSQKTKTREFCAYIYICLRRSSCSERVPSRGSGSSQKKKTRECCAYIYMNIYTEHTRILLYITFPRLFTCCLATMLCVYIHIYIPLYVCVGVRAARGCLPEDQARHEMKKRGKSVREFQFRCGASALQQLRIKKRKKYPCPPEHPEKCVCRKRRKYEPTSNCMCIQRVTCF